MDTAFSSRADAPRFGEAMKRPASDDGASPAHPAKRFKQETGKLAKDKPMPSGFPITSLS